MLFSIGDKVKHNIYGVGEVEKSDSRVSAVYFEDNEEVKSILNEYLILVEQTKLVPTNEETLDIYPKNFDEISAVFSSRDHTNFLWYLRFIINLSSRYHSYNSSAVLESISKFSLAIRCISSI